MNCFKVIVAGLALQTLLCGYASARNESGEQKLTVTAVAQSSVALTVDGDGNHKLIVANAPASGDNVSRLNSTSTHKSSVVDPKTAKNSGGEIMVRIIKTFTLMLALMGTFQTAAIAQNGRMGTNAGQAVLTIQVQVVPAAMLPAQPVNQGNQSVSYSITVAPARLNVTENNQFINLAGPTGKIEPRPVNAITVVPE